MNNQTHRNAINPENNSADNTNIMRSASEPDFINTLQLARQICGKETAILGIIDAEKVLVKSRLGISPSLTELPGGVVFFKQIFGESDVVNLGNIESDNRFRKNPGFAMLGLYSFAGTQVKNTDGIVVGYLVVLGSVKEEVSEAAAMALPLLASSISTIIRLTCENVLIAEQKRLTTEHLMKMVFKNSIDAVVVTDTQCSVLLWNPKAQEIFGWDDNEAFGENFCWNKLQGIAFDSTNKNSGIGSQKMLPEKAIETTIYNHKNQPIDINFSISLVQIGSAEYYVYDIVDISERKKAARALEEQRVFYENILNNLPIDIAVFSNDHRYLYVNPTAIRDPKLRKYIIGRDDFEYAKFRNRSFDMAEHRRAKFLEAKKYRKEVGWEDTLTNSEGINSTHLRRMFPVFDESGELLMMIGLGMDITDRKELEDKQTTLLEKLSQQNVQLSDFCNIVSHNLRAPLVNIAMLSEFIENCSDNDERKQLILSLNNVLDNLNSTFNELVESIQIQEDPDVKSEHLQINKYLQRILESLEPEIVRSGATFAVDIDNAPTIHYPVTYFNSILHNLISNALKYRSPERKPEIRISSHRKGNKIFLSVADNGLGIDMQKHKNNFFKIGKVFHHHPDAKGFGLYMIKAHIEALGGKIWVESAPDKGATFHIEFTNQNQ